MSHPDDREDGMIGAVFAYCPRVTRWSSGVSWSQNGLYVFVKKDGGVVAHIQLGGVWLLDCPAEDYSQSIGPRITWKLSHDALNMFSKWLQDCDLRVGVGFGYNSHMSRFMAHPHFAQLLLMVAHNHITPCSDLLLIQSFIFKFKFSVLLTCIAVSVIPIVMLDLKF